ncbi:MAG: MBL fold metallo-hydrolase [Gammaproteobacteria bacterium]|nr:MBL fold metallo-hydrolase [Gammaproteobacteria bacterium]
MNLTFSFFSISKTILLAGCLFCVQAMAQNNALSLKKIDQNVYAIFGQLGDRSAENLGNNANFGFIITADGIVLIDSGASFQGAQAIHSLIKTVSEQPVIYVINTGGQDHRWLGNDYFSRLGAKIIASKAATKDHTTRANSQIERLTSAIGEANIKDTKPKFADIQFDRSYSLQVAATQIEIIHAGSAHTPGDSIVWLPQSKTAFSGDIVYTQRLLGIISVSNSKSWVNAFEALKNLEPGIVIPGHGKTTDLASAIKDTYRYLTTLREKTRDFMDAGNGIESISAISQDEFSYLKNYDILKGRNAQKVFEELEWE